MIQEQINMKRRVSILILIALYFITLPAFAAKKISKKEEKRLVKIERYVYGDSQSGKEEDRLKQVEEDLFGRSTGQPVPDKLKYLNDLLFRGTADSPSLDMKVSFLEWRLFNKTGEGTLERRLAELDKQVIGSVSMEPMAFRLEQLAHLTIDNGYVSMHPVTIPKGTIIKLKLEKSLSSRRTKKTDLVPFIVADDLFIDGNILAISKGGIISGSVKKVRRGGRFGRTGYIGIDVNSIESMDSSMIPVEIADSGQKKFDRKKIGMAVGAATLGYVVLGPIGVAGGAFIKGKDVEIPRGTEVTVRTLDDRQVVGVLVHRK
jgi:hypothetical protein